MAKVYIAAPLGDAARAESLARRLRRQGTVVVSSWHASVSPGETDPGDPDERRRILALNLEELGEATVVLAVTDGRARPRATYGEVAWALAKDLPVVWLAGAGGCLFDAHPAVTLVRSEQEALACICP